MSSSPDLVTLTQVQASLSLFAEAIAGHPVVFAATEEPGECWPYSPSEPANEHVLVPSSLMTRGHLRSLVLHQVQVGYSAHRPAPELRALFEEVYPVVEDHRVHAATRRDYPGAAAELDQVLALGAEVVTLGFSIVDELRRYSLTGTTQSDGELVTVAIRIIDGVTVPGATAADSGTAAEQVCALLVGAQVGRSFRDLVVDIEVADDEPALPSDGPTSVSLDGGTPSEFVDSEGLSGGQLLSDGDELVPTAAAAEPGEDEAPKLGVQLPWSSNRSAIDGDVRTFVYDEWDYHAQQHRNAWCRVIEEKLVGDDHGFITDVRTRHQALRARIRRSLMQIRSQELVRVYRSDDGDELDLDAVIEAMADRRSGAPADERLHIRRDRAARDVATAFLVDLSASTSSAAVPPEPEPIPESDPMDDPLSYGPIWGAAPPAEPVRRVIDVAKDAVALMGDALHELGDRYAIYGFSGTGRDAVEFKIGKDFDDRVSPVSWAAVAEMKPLRYTRMGPAVRHAANKLASEPARTKLLIVVSDGYPQDTDYGEDRHDREYGIQDTARALADANAIGIETFCVTIDPAGHDYLRTMSPDHRYLVIDDVESLPEALAKLYIGRFNTVGRVEIAPNT